MKYLQKINKKSFFCFILFVFSVAFSNYLYAQTDPLPSWNDTSTRKYITQFVQSVANPASPDYVEPEDRVAVFDNDGNLWIEQPLYTQLAFAIDRIKAMAPEHPEWKETEPYKSVLNGDYSKLDKKGLLEIITTTHSGMTTDEFELIASAWFKTSKHPRFKRSYSELIYQPMVELLEYLRANGFKTYIVSGGGIDFMRPVTEKLYGIPPEQVVGTSVVSKFEVRDGKPVLVKMPEIFFIDDKAGKPVGIHQFIGKRPIFASGNSDGDYEMLLWTTSGPGKTFGLLLHHDDADREYAYDRKSHIGKLDKALDAASKNKWVVVSMKRDWKTIFPFEN